jgi:hypothetical protein
MSNVAFEKVSEIGRIVVIAEIYGRENWGCFSLRNVFSAFILMGITK